MSFTQARNPRTVGRGAPRGVTQPLVPGQKPRQPSTELPHSASGPSCGSGASSCPRGSCGNVGEQTESHQAYTMIAPNEEKRRSILEKAKVEEANYQRYKETQKMGYVSCGGTVGGASCGAPLRQRQRQRNTTFNSKQKSEQYREEEKRRETEEIDRKKTEQRRKADRNKREEDERQERLRQEHRRVNSAFLRKLERH